MQKLSGNCWLDACVQLYRNNRPEAIGIIVPSVTEPILRRRHALHLHASSAPSRRDFGIQTFETVRLRRQADERPAPPPHPAPFRAPTSPARGEVKRRHLSVDGPTSPLKGEVGPKVRVRVCTLSRRGRG